MNFNPAHRRIVTALWFFIYWMILGGLAGAQVSIATVSPGTGTTGTEITITGGGFVKKPSVYLIQNGAKKKYTAKVISFGPTQVVASLPKAVPGVFDVFVKVQASTAQADDAITIAAPVVSDIAPLSVAPKDIITIEGDFFGTAKGTVKTGKTSAKIKTWSNSQITFEAPKLPDGNYTFTVDNKVGTVVTAAVAIAGTGGGMTGGFFIKAKINNVPFEASGAFLSVQVLPTTPPLLAVAGSKPGNPDKTLDFAIPFDAANFTVPATFTEVDDGTLAWHENIKIWFATGQGTHYTIHVTKKQGNILEGTFSGHLKELFIVDPDVDVTDGAFRVQIP